MDSYVIQPMRVALIGTWHHLKFYHALSYDSSIPQSEVNSNHNQGFILPYLDLSFLGLKVILETKLLFRPTFANTELWLSQS